MSVKLGRYVFRKIGGRIVPIRAGANTDSIKGVSRQALRKLDAVRNKERAKKIAEFTKDSVVKNPVYHGTNATFKKFKHEKIGSSIGTAQGRGFYFAKDKFTASGYGKKVSEYFLNIKKPVIGSLNDGFKQNSINDSQIAKLAEGQDLSNWGGWGKRNPLDNLRDAVRKDNDIDKIQEIGQTVYHNNWKKALDKVRKITGIDGSIASNNKVTHYVAYNSDQIMKAPKKSNFYKKIQRVRYSNRKK